VLLYRRQVVPATRWYHLPHVKWAPTFIGGDPLGAASWVPRLEAKRSKAMQITMMKGKIHRATVTGADLNYEGSISIDPVLASRAGFLLHERVEIYDCDNGARFATYVIAGKDGEICLNGAAARLVHPGDKVIIVAYCQMSPEEAALHQPAVVMVDDHNRIKAPEVVEAAP